MGVFMPIKETQYKKVPIINNVLNCIIDERVKELKDLISNEEEFNIIFDSIKSKVVKKFEWKFIYSDKDVFKVTNDYLIEEIIKRRRLNKC